MIRCKYDGKQFILKVEATTSEQSKYLSMMIRKLPGYQYDRKCASYTVPLLEYKTMLESLNRNLKIEFDKEKVDKDYDDYVKVFKAELIKYNPYNFMKTIDIDKEYDFLKMPPRNYQKLCIEWIAANKGPQQILGGLVADEVGLGKTFQSVAGICKLKEQGTVNRGIILTLSGLKIQWGDEISRFTSESFTIVTSKMEKKKRLELYKNFNETFLIINYEMYLQDAKEILELKSVNENLDFDFVILDEAQKIRNANSKTFSAVYMLQPKIKILLTGTPIKKDVVDLFGIFHYLNPDILMGWSYFSNKFLSYKKKFGRYMINGAKDEYKKFLHIMIAPYMIRRKSKDVSKDIPELNEVFIDVELSKEQRRWKNIIEREMKASEEAAEEAIKDKKDDLAKRKENFNKSLYTVMSMIADDLTLLTLSKSNIIKKLVEKHKIRDFSSPKLDLLVQYIDEMIYEANFMTGKKEIRDEKLIIFTEYEEFISIIENKIKSEFDSEIKILKYTGKMNKNCKRLIKDKMSVDCSKCQYFKECNSVEKSKFLFINDKSQKILICTNSASTGLNLQVARYIINIDLPFDPGTLDQRGGRIKRLGSIYDNVFVYNFYAKDCLDEGKVGVIKKRRENIEDSVEFTASERYVQNSFFNK